MSALQYDNGQLYLSTDVVLNASTGTLLGTFYSTASTPAFLPVVSDSTLGRAFIAQTSFSNSGGQVLAFDESSFNLTGTIQVNGVGTQGYPTSFRKLRWGQNGVALSTVPSAFSSTNQIFIFQSPLVKNLSSSPANLSVSLTAPATPVQPLPGLQPSATQVRTPRWARRWQ